MASVLLLWVTLASGAEPEGNKAVVDWMRAHAVALQTPEAGHGFRDMQPLKQIVGNARIVALGEATHGTREFFQLKHRMLEFLASEMGFTIFSIEASMPEAYRLNDYVLNGNGDPAQLLKGMYFWTWDTQEVLAMIRWMREFNQSGKGRIEFTGFDMQFPDVAMRTVHDFVTKNDFEYLASLQKASDVARAAGPQGEGQSFAVATASFPVKAAAGKKVRFSGYIKSLGITRGFAGLWWRVDGASGVLAFDNMQKHGVTGTTDWKRYEIELPVAANTTNINFGAILSGDGAAWFDDLTVEPDGAPYSDVSTFDLGFESSTAKGFYTGGKSYSVHLDNQTFHSGKQSLQMRFSPDMAKNSVDPKTAANSWKEVVHHLEATRAFYLSQGPSNHDVDWAIQNAMIVLQGLQAKSGEMTRDQCMAENVKWIADHNPNAKIVIWAHNGHVAFGGWPGYEPMGSALRKMFGDKMVVFGFAF
jgi:erythromycin esterase-like protein